MLRRARRLAVVLLALAAPPASAAPRITPPLALAWVDPTERAVAASEGAMREAVAVLRTAGIEVRWRRAEPKTLLAPGEVAVIMVAPPPGNTRMVMGSTQVGGSVPAVWVHPETVAFTLGLDARPGRAWTGRDQADFARALGRVAAHEIVHAVLGSPRHASLGLMSRALVRRDLLSPRLPVDPETRRALGRALADPVRWTAR